MLAYIEANLIMASDAIFLPLNYLRIELKIYEQGFSK